MYAFAIFRSHENRSMDITERHEHFHSKAHIYIHRLHRIQNFNILWLKRIKKQTNTHKFSMKIAMWCCCCSWVRNYFAILFDVETISMAILAAIIFIFAIYLLFGFCGPTLIFLRHLRFPSPSIYTYDSHWIVLVLDKIWQFSCCSSSISVNHFLSLFLAAIWEWARRTNEGVVKCTLDYLYLFIVYGIGTILLGLFKVIT